MKVSARVAGTLEVAAALAFHLPGARLDLSSPSGAACSVGPLTDPRCVLHPAEFRELIMSAGAGDALGSILNCKAADEPSLCLTTTAHGVDHLGAGLYRASSRESTSYAFATPLAASHVDRALSELQADGLAARGGDAPSPLAGADETIFVNIVRDDGLGVTLVVMCAVDGPGSAVSETIAQAAAAACLVAEMEHLHLGPHGTPE